MRLFADTGGPRLFSLPPGADYAADFAAGLRERLAGAPPEAALDVAVHVNTRRALRAIEEALADGVEPGGAVFLPRLSVLADLAEDPAEAGLPPAVDDLRRHLVLVRLVERFLASGRGRAPVAAAADLAATLADLIDELDEEGVAPDRLDGAVEGELARHWEEALLFADIVRRQWPAIRAEAFGASLDPADRQRRAVEALIARWQEAPPATPVIVAGSTGSRAVTAELMAAVARLPQGAVVLPGFDPGEDPAIWRTAGADHPMGPFRRLFARLGVGPEAVEPWRPAAPAPRRRLLAEALRPAPVTDAWVAARDRLGAEAGEAVRGLTLLEAATPREEAAAIALAIREGLERPGLRIALVTPDATLARRVTAELGRFGVLPDDSLGRPLAQSPAGVFLELVAAAASPEPDVVRLAALLGHPFCRAGRERGAHLALARDYEREALRRTAPFGLAPGRLPPWPPRREGTGQAAGQAPEARAPGVAAPDDAAPMDAAPMDAAADPAAIREAGPGAMPGASPEVTRGTAVARAVARQTAPLLPRQVVARSAREAAPEAAPGLAARGPVPEAGRGAGPAGDAGADAPPGVAPETVREGAPGGDGALPAGVRTGDDAAARAGTGLADAAGPEAGTEAGTARPPPARRRGTSSGPPGSRGSRPRSPRSPPPSPGARPWPGSSRRTGRRRRRCRARGRMGPRRGPGGRRPGTGRSPGRARTGNGSRRSSPASPTRRRRTGRSRWRARPTSRSSPS